MWHPSTEMTEIDYEGVEVTIRLLLISRESLLPRNERKLHMFVLQEMCLNGRQEWAIYSLMK